MIEVGGIEVLKKCTLCKRHLPFPCFSWNRARFDGYECYCRDCNTIKAKKWRENNRKRMNEILCASRARYRDRINARSLAHYTYPIRVVCNVDGCTELGERHHNDYSKAKEIVWLCRMHHHLLYHNNLDTLVRGRV